MIYWTDQSDNPQVQRATLNGTIDDSFQVSNSVIKPGAIAVRLKTNEIYWAETQVDNWSIERGQFNEMSGTTSTYIDLDANEPYGGEIAGMDFLQDKLYFTER